MKDCSLITLLTLALAFPQFAPAQTADASKQSHPAPQKDPAFETVQDRPGLPRVLLIGDSISIGYTIPVRTLLRGKANLHRIPENGGPTITGLKNMEKWLGDSKWDVIHFNWGLHDLKFMDDGKHQVAIESYERNLTELVKQLKATGARLIWCSTTPVPDAKVNPPRRNDDVLAFNAAARKVMEANQISIDDLYAHAWPKLAEIQLPANVHYTKQGSEFLAEQVAKSIELALAQK
jgi:hypothetical protein